MKFDVVEAWISSVAYSHSGSRATASHYRRYLDKFCGFIECTPQQILDDYERMRDREFKRKYAQYLRAFISSGSQNGYAPGSLRYIAGVVKSFFKYNDLPLGYVPFAPDKITYHNRDITKEEIKKILSISKPRERAFYAIIIQSGLRPSTLGELRRRHIEPDFSDGIIPCNITVPEELTKGKFGAYFTFMGAESAKYLAAYFEGSRKNTVKPSDLLFTSEGSDKPLNEKAMTRIFKEHIERLKVKGLIDFEQAQPGKPRSLRLYTLRKYFRRNAAKAGVEYVNFWMGHKVNYKAKHIPASDEHYFSREDVKFHRDLYREHAMPYLRIESRTPYDLERILREKTKEMEKLAARLDRLETSYQALLSGDEILIDIQDEKQLRALRWQPMNVVDYPLFGPAEEQRKRLEELRKQGATHIRAKPLKKKRQNQSDS